MPASLPLPCENKIDLVGTLYGKSILFKHGVGFAFQHCSLALTGFFNSICLNFENQIWYRAQCLRGFYLAGQGKVFNTESFGMDNKNLEKCCSLVLWLHYALYLNGGFPRPNLNTKYSA